MLPLVTIIIDLPLDGTYTYTKEFKLSVPEKNLQPAKYDNLVKPFMIVSCDGHIIDVVGPYAATQTDAEIINNLFVDEESQYRQLFQPNDVFILDFWLTNPQTRVTGSWSNSVKY
ncbi:hypothetical protein PYW08_006109 [Mythimna loreyi]|uniref:Uncharacterized protein n=1 Tax=Mythimna loreyi TaxID=667449 RepID=A0ACC2QPA0_9NEOP|nr:hypothetical protein PYW08_006109 [Mythimna loreyi]